MNEEPEEGFIGRWSRRKRHDREDDATRSEAAPLTDESRSPEQIEERRVQLEANRAAAEAVDLDAIGYESDLSVFYKEGVPALLKQAAMRKMWRTNPVFANLDGLNDYDHDYNVIDRILTEFKSAWQIGRGYAQKDEETAEAPGAAGGEEPEDGETALAPGADDEIGAVDTLAGEPASGVDHGGPPTPDGNAADTADANADDGHEETEAEADVRPTVSLRRRMARFDQD